MGIHAAMRRLRRLREKYPDARPHKLLQHERALSRRRAKNRRARASRKANR